MSMNRCARCGRERPAWDDGGTGTGPLPLRGVPEAAWATFEGHEVCPQCQTDDERREAAQRVVVIIEAEIERRRREGVSPDPYEAALIGYAMAIRARAEGDPSEEKRPPESEGSPDPVADADPRRLRVYFTGAFLTGHPLAVRLDGYDRLQQKVSSALRELGWRVTGSAARDGTYESGGGFARAVPLVIARRDASTLLPALCAALRGFHDTRGEPIDECGGTLTAATADDLAIDVYDLGVAVITARVDVTIAADTGLDKAARALKRLAWLRPTGSGGRSRLADELDNIAADTARDYGSAVRRAAPTEGWLSRTLTVGDGESDRPPDAGGRLLWLHPVHVLETPVTGLGDAHQLAPTFRETITVKDGVFATGIEWSAVAVTEFQGADTPVRLTALHWAYYALYMEIDRGLLEVLNQERWIEDASLQRLEEDAEDVFADYLRVMEARARLDSYLNALGGDELAIWETIAKVQRFDALVDAVSRKLGVLETVAERRVTQADNDRTRRIGKVLGYLAGLTLVTVAGGVIGVVLGARSPGVNAMEVRVVALAGAFALALLLYWITFVRSVRVTPRPRRGKQVDEASRDRPPTSGGRSPEHGSANEGTELADRAKR